MQKVAFFDIDGTVFRSSLLVELVEALVLHGVFPAEARTTYQEARVLWQNREGSYDQYIEKVIQSFRTHIIGVSYGVLKDVGREVVSVQGKRVYQYTRDRIRELREDGYHLIAISQSPKSILDEFCDGLGFHKVYGRIYELSPQNQFTGVVADEEIIATKSKIIERVFETGEYTQSGSVGVGDTEGDIALLSLVEYPTAFNPNRILYEHARRAGWPIVVERKDMIYTL
jgi:HAD superfamily phosphoserine phosphatase-like hydrolase